MRPIETFAVALLLACGGSHSSQSASRSAFALVTPGAIQVHATETTVVTLVALGATGPVTFDVAGLPPFAIASGNTIRVTPSRNDHFGDSQVTVTASDGQHSDTGSFVISLVDGPPAWSTLTYRDASGVHPLGASQAATQNDGRWVLDATATDPDGDPVQLVAELRPAGATATGTPNVLGTAGNPLHLELPNPPEGEHNWLEVWLRDSHGLDGSHVRVDDLVHVNSPPFFSDLCQFHDDNGGALMPNERFPFQLHGPVRLECPFADYDGDDVQMVVEVRPMDSAFTGDGTDQSPFVANSRVDYVFAFPHDGDIDLPLPDLPIGVPSQIQAWMRDVHGASSSQHIVQKNVTRVE